MQMPLTTDRIGETVVKTSFKWFVAPAERHTRPFLLQVHVETNELSDIFKWDPMPTMDII